ncbi:MAG: hypothetical protein A2849_00150 [Candidatus Taylorbacteria bacterium RIFCSPHIGHO2_01_FULL_51_15]|uniref:CARDB domain-containing protein n=1 Tax=Candidatus Taylorbacteria bacterium RIFCSPHIGHO2_01_FULL_51_15 TaxID=1802304 RepID=A0A1G2MCF3_9BACT|nr:MAG: hypothetical protein A2849_00150 [Candidatus Taylorbacteria bacterium RIFCSPHIGHO2_01_FULL_51_15]
MSTSVSFFRTSALAVAAMMFVFPALASADTAEDFGSIPSSPAGKVTLSVQMGTAVSKGNVVNVPAGTPITLVWTVPTGWKGCWSNWQSAAITASGSLRGNIPAGQARRAFILTCFGVGQSQTVALTVNVVKPDLTVSSFTGSATAVGPTPAVPAVPANPNANPPVEARRAIPAKSNKGLYYAGTPGTGAASGGIVLKATAKNSGKTPAASGGFVFAKYEWAQTTTPTKAGTSWQLLKEGFIDTPIAPNKTGVVDEYSHAATPGGPYYFRITLDSTGVVNEAKEDNNMRIIGPYTFVAR